MMPVKRPNKSPWAAIAILAAAPFAPAQDTAIAPPARNWTLPLFTKEGFRQMTLRGDIMRPVTVDRVDISGMSVTVFSGTAEAKVDSVLLSPEATFLLNEKVARGDGPVRLVRDDVEVTGIGWTYYYNEKKVLISRHAHVVFHSALPDILK
jgi:hypothetical protein